MLRPPSTTIDNISLPGAIYFNPITGHHVQAHDTGGATTKTWTEAETLAASRTHLGQTGHLVSIKSDLENRYVDRIAGGDSTWIGLNDASNEGDWYWDGETEVAGNMVWQGQAGGSSPNGFYTKWNGGEPNDSGGEDYVEQINGGNWNDQKTATTRWYVIEYNTPTTNTGTFTVRQVRPDTGTNQPDGNTQVNSLAEAEALLAGDPDYPVGTDVSGEAVAINFWTGGLTGDFNQDNGYLDADFPDGGGDDFVVEAIGYVEIPTAGDWDFKVWHDDNARIQIDSTTPQDSAGCCNSDTFTYTLDAGMHKIRVMFFERGGGDYFELSARTGTDDFKLIGDTAAGGLAVVVPEPGTMAILVLGGLGVLARRRRK